MFQSNFLLAELLDAKRLIRELKPTRTPPVEDERSGSEGGGLWRKSGSDGGGELPLGSPDIMFQSNFLLTELLDAKRLIRELKPTRTPPVEDERSGSEGGGLWRKIRIISDF